MNRRVFNVLISHTLLLHPLQVWFYMFWLFLSHTFRIPITDRNRLVARCLLQNITYRLPSHAAKDRLIGFRMLFRLIRLMLKQKEPVLGPSNAWIYDGRKNAESLRKNYVEWHTGLNTEFIAREELIFLPRNLAGVVLLFLLILSSPFYLFITLFLPSRVNTSLMLFEWVENTNLYGLCKAYNIKRLFFFSPYEKDANLAARLLIEQGVYVSKHPSPGPLMTHNAGLIANELMLSNQYQVDEFTHFKSTMFVDRHTKWLPEFSQQYLGKYTGEHKAAAIDTVGYYTSASWLRRKLGHANNGHNTFESEQVVLDCLRQVLMERPSVHLIIFLHPREKHDSQIDEAKQYYRSFFQGADIDFASTELKTTENFNSVDLAVAAYSTTIYERLFCGFKTLAYYAGTRSFPLLGSSLENIVLKDPVSFKNKIIESLGIGTERFFEFNKLEGYRYSEFDQFGRMHLPNTDKI